MRIYQSYFKRPLDVVLSATALIVLSPVIGLTALWLWKANEGAGVLFRQRRPGRGGRIFNVYKFKTMTDRRGPDGELLPDAQRITRAGRVVRAASLDELPQLLNVLRGEMSLIGPRPLLPQYLPLYSARQARRHEVRPGITGWAQSHGRNATTWPHRLEMDVWYVDNVTLRTDLRVIWATVRSVVRRQGINAGQGVTMQPFRGEH